MRPGAAAAASAAGQTAVVRLQCVWRLRVVAAVTHTRTIATATTQMEQVPIHALDSGCYKLRCPRRVRGLGVVTGLGQRSVPTMGAVVHRQQALVQSRNILQQHVHLQQLTRAWQANMQSPLGLPADKKCLLQMRTTTHGLQVRADPT